MRNNNLTIMRSIAPDPADAPATGCVGSIVTVVAGRVMGGLIRSIGGQPGPRTVTHDAYIAIDGHDTDVRFADIQIGDAQTLRDLAAVVAFLADELASAQAHQTAIDAATACHPAGSARRKGDEER
jgi:hypothetical protein